MLRKALLLATLAAVAVPGTAAAKSGIVVKVDRAGALTAVAGTHGSVALVHGKASAAMGSRVTFAAKPLANGTLSTTTFRVVGHAKRVHVRGLVLAHRAGGYLMSAHGAVLAIRVLRHTQSANDTGTPPVGTTVDVTASISADQLDQEDAQPLLTDARSGAIEGHLVTAPAGTIAVRSEGLTLVIAVPTGFDTSKFALGDEVLASFQRQADGSLLLTALASNDQTGEEQDDDSNDDNDDGDDNDHGSSSTSGGTITGTVTASSNQSGSDHHGDHHGGDHHGD
jgi:hypothetical protein